MVDEELWAYSHEHRIIIDRVVEDPTGRLVTQITRETEGEVRSRCRGVVYYPDCYFMTWRRARALQSLPHSGTQ